MNTKKISNKEILEKIKKIKSNNLYYIERRIKDIIIKYNAKLDVDFIDYILDYLEYKEKELKKECKYVSLQCLLTQDLC